MTKLGLSLIGLIPGITRYNNNISREKANKLILEWNLSLLLMYWVD